VGSGLRPEDVLCRWTGPTLVAVLRRDMPFERTKKELSSALNGRLEREIKLGTRTVLMPLSCNWTLFPSTGPVEVVSRKLDAFFASQASQDSYAY
jgi:hypothetical protein